MGETPQASELTPAQVAWRTVRGRCPNCGEGQLFRRFLKVADHCNACGEAFHHHRADDLPAYVVIVIVGHVIIPLVLAIEMEYQPSYWIHFSVWLPATLGMSLALLQPTKGLVVGLQWHLGMHGFQESRERRRRAADARALAQSSSIT